jgi:hypothetical protein
MKNLLIKEFKLAAHPMMYIFLSFGAMLLIPSYPYHVPFFYLTLGIFMCFMQGRENNDVLYTAALPVKKRDAVKARCVLIGSFELAMLIIAVPFAFISVRINPNGSNLAGIDANIALFGSVLIMFSIFNWIYITYFYKKAYKAGVAFILSCFAMAIYIVIAEGLVMAVPGIHEVMDSTDPDDLVKQLPVLGVGIAIFAGGLIGTYFKAAGEFEKVDL